MNCFWLALAHWLPIKCLGGPLRHGAPRSARVNHSLTAVPDRADASESAPTSGRIYLFGGDDGQSPRNDCWVYDVARDEWEEPELRGEGRRRGRATR